MNVRSAIVRPWLKAGLSALLLDSEQRVAALRGTEERTVPASPASGKERAAGGKPVQRDPAGTVPASRQVAGQGAGRAAARPPRDFVPDAGARRPVPERASTDLLATPGALPVEQWPAGWLALKNRRPLPPHPLVLWTYAGLGEDLTGTPDEARRQVIVRMLMELRHPGGTHVFWPCGLAGEQDGPGLFWSGVKLLNPRVLLLFGSDARDTLSMPKTLLPFCQERVYGRLVIQLPRPQALAADEASFKRALAFLSRFLSFCSRRQA